MGYDWETLPDCGESVRRLPVPGGWLYQIRMEHAVFVPEPAPKVTIVHNVSVPGPAKALGALPTEAQVVVEAKVLSDLTEALTRLLGGVKHYDKPGTLLHECDVAEVALEKLTDHRRQSPEDLAQATIAAWADQAKRRTSCSLSLYLAQTIREDRLDEGNDDADS